MWSPCGAVVFVSSLFLCLLFCDMLCRVCIHFQRGEKCYGLSVNPYLGIT